jgi:hypothetical protein
VRPSRDNEAHLRRDSFLLRDVEPGFGWNPLSLAGGGNALPVDRRPVRPAQPAPAPRVMPKPERAQLTANPAMARRLAEHEFKPWWCR